jgi:hypothetical protein
VSDPFVLVGVALGLALLVIYLLIKGPNATVFDGLSLVSSGVGFLAGIKLCYFSYLFRNTPPIKDVSVQTLLGGIAVIWVTVVIAAKKFRP